MTTIRRRWVDRATPLLDAVWPTYCAACPGAARPTVGRSGLCAGCLRRLGFQTPRVTRPRARRALPCLAMGRYDGTLRECLLAYKERGRLDLTRALTGLLARAVDCAVEPGAPGVLVPIPATRRARRARGFDHVARLCRGAAGEVAGVRTARLLSTASRDDFAGMSAGRRGAAARASMRPARRPRWPTRRDPESVSVVLVDDIVTTGATLAAASWVLEDMGVPVCGAVVLATTPYRKLSLFPPLPVVPRGIQVKGGDDIGGRKS